MEIDRSLEKAHSCGPRGQAYHLPFCSICPRYGAQPVREASDHLPLVSFAQLYCARPERASLSLPFCAFAPLWRAARPRSERSVGGPVIISLLFHFPTFMAREGEMGAGLPADSLRGQAAPQSSRKGKCLARSGSAPRVEQRQIMGPLRSSRYGTGRAP